MDNHISRWYVWAYAAVFAAGALIRFVSLARLPLSDSESVLALQALDLARGPASQLAPQPGYLSLTGLLFFIFGSSDFLARLWPALAGSLLVLAPALYRRFLGAAAALALAAFLALDPTLVSASRTASGTMLAVSFLVLSVGFYLNHRAVLAGICAGLALLGGPQLWPGLILVAVLAWRLSHVRLAPEAAQDHDETSPAPRTALNTRAGLIALLVTTFLTGTLLFRAPYLLAGIPSSLLAYLRGWTVSQGVSVFMLLGTLIFYELFVLLAGLAGLLTRAVRRSLSPLPLGLLVAFILVLAYPSRQPVDLVWVVLPLAALAARLVVRWIFPEELSLAPVLAETLLTVVLLGFAFLNMQALSIPGGQDNTLRAAAMWSGIGLLLITSVLMVWGWSLQTMRTGLTYGLVVLLAVFTLSAVVNAAGLGRDPQVEMLRDNTIQDEDLLRGTVEDLALWTKGDRGVIDVAVVGIDSPSLHWALRKVEKLDFVTYLPQETQPSIVITPEQQTVNLANTYRGQDFVWKRQAAWSVFLENEWLRWLTLREAPTETTTYILWARTDLFPGGAAQPVQSTNP